MAAWTIICLEQMNGLLATFLAAFRILSQPDYLAIFITGFPIALLKVAFQLALAGVLALGFAGIGSGALGILFHSRSPDHERTLAGILVGFAVLGTAYFSLALTGLFFPALAYLLLASAFLSPSTWNVLRILRVPRIGGIDRGIVWKAFFFLPMGITLLLMCLPDTNGDAMMYHLAVSEQAFRSHRLTDIGVLASYNYPLTAELVYGLAVACGNDALPHFIQFVPFTAALALLGSWCARNGGGTARLVAWGVILSLGPVAQMMIVAKNDLVAAAFPAAGAVFVAWGMSGRSYRRLLLGAVLLGCGAAIKHNSLPILALAGCAIGAWSVRTRLLRIAPAWAGIAVLPAVPWMLKSWLMLGDPFWPAMASIFPHGLTDPESNASLRLFLHRGEAGYRLTDFPAILLRSLVNGHPAVAFALPLGLIGARNAGRETGFLMLFAVAGIAVIWAAFPLSDMRYALPLFIVCAACLAVIVTRMAAGWPRWAAKCLLTATIVAGWLPLGNLLLSGIEPGFAFPYLAGRIDREEYLANRLTSFRVISMRMQAIPGLRRVLLLDGVYSYHLPGIRVRGRWDGRSWPWAAARESGTAGEIGKKLRQLGCNYMLSNFVRENEPSPIVEPYTWDSRALNVWKDFVGRCLDIAVPPPILDSRTGGFCLYRLRRNPLPRSPGYLPYLPGILAPLYAVNRQFQRGDMKAYLAEALRLQKILPGVDSVNNMVALGYRTTGRWKEAYDAYRGGILHGTLDCENVFGMALAADKLGRKKEAARLAVYARAVYPLLSRLKERMLSRPVSTAEEPFQNRSKDAVSR